MTTKRVVWVAIVAALYVVLTVGIAPFSFGPVQFRISEALKVFVLFDPFLALGIGIGTLLANLASPFVGPWELIFMPLTDILGGFLAWWVFRLLRKRWAVVPCALYAVTTALSVALMLWAMGIDLFWLSLLFVGASELVILVGAVPVLFLPLKNKMTSLHTG
jgi:uncharacterized membrane protein